MIIKLSKDCRIAGEDGIQFTLQVRERITDRAVGGKVSDRAGEMSNWKTRGYYGSLEQAFKAVLKRSVLTQRGEVDAKKLIVHLEAVTKRIEAVCEGLVGAAGAADMEGQVASEDLDELFAEVG